jgi:hypothetical protein
LLADVERIKRVLLYIVCVPLLMLLTVLYPVLVIVYLVWTEVISKTFAAMSSRNHA